ncbi:MAG: hypothetical protein WD894_25485 [Pirellulales bacterium]
MFDPDDDRPMTEAQWEALFRKSDLKAAKYEELLETFRDEPDGQLIIAREMGWKRLADALEERAAQNGDSQVNHSSQPAETDPTDTLDDEETIDDWLEDAFEDDDDDDNSSDCACAWDAERDQLNRIPAYRAARSLADRVGKALRPLMEEECADEDLGRLLGEGYISAHQAAVKIAGGHAMGYDEDVLCGNIVNNRISLDAMYRCQLAWAELQEQQIIARHIAEPLVAEMREVQKLIEERIAELRSHVWW